MLILSWNLAPIPMESNLLTNDGMINTMMDGVWQQRPGVILQKWSNIRKAVGTVPKEKKPGMKFETLSSENVIDKVRAACDDEGVLVYPVNVQGSGKVVEDGTLADVNQTFRVQALEDGSYIEIAGFGLGADSQDKAGGKAGTYSLKAALVQALLAGGSKKKGGVKTPDTDDEDEPIKGGVKPKTNAPQARPVEDIRKVFQLAQTKEEYAAAVVEGKRLHPNDQQAIMADIVAAKERCNKPVE